MGASISAETSIGWAEGSADGTTLAEASAGANTISSPEALPGTSSSTPDASAGIT